MTHFRKRVGEEALETLLQETLAAAYRGGALSVRATEVVAVDTTVQEKAIAHPTEHALLLTAIKHLGRQAKKTGLRLRQSYVRVARRAAMKTGRYLHAQQKRRAKRQVKFLRVRLRRLIRDVRRKMAGLPALAESSTYDSNGNTLTKTVGSSTTTYARDFEDRLTGVTLPGSGGAVSFKYDGPSH